MDYLAHHGILGQKWGIRRYQNEDGSLTAAGVKHFRKLQEKAEKQDNKWAYKNQNKIINDVKKQVKQTVAERMATELSGIQQKNSDGSYNRYYLSKASQILADEMTKKSVSIGNVTPNGRAIRFVAERGTYGVNIALGGSDDDLAFYKNGISSNGKVAYRNKYVEQQNYD